MKRTFIFRNGKLIEKKNENPSQNPFNVWKDIAPYKSMITGEMIGDRRTHREHLRRHQCIEVGNDSAFNK